MADDPNKPIVIEFDAEGRTYRAIERPSHTGAEVVDVLTGEISTFSWPRTLRERFGSEWMMDDTVEGWRAYASAVTRRRAIVAAEMEKAEAGRKREASGQTTDP